MPVYNSGEFINATLAGLIRIVGNRTDVEIIVQDSCSTDGTGEIVSCYAKKFHYIQHFIEKDSGQSDGINRGAKRAKGEYITWLCADDMLLSSFSICLQQMEFPTPDVIYADCIMLLENKEIAPAIGTENHTAGSLARKRMVLQQPGTCVKRRLWNEMGGVDPKLNWTMDYDFFLRLESRKVQFLRIEEFVAVARIHQEAKTSSGSGKRLLEHWKILFRAHARNISYFSLRPYLLYGIEYIIKNREAKGKTKGIAHLHKLFWKLGLPSEKDQITERFQKEEQYFKEEIAELDKGCCN